MRSDPLSEIRNVVLWTAVWLAGAVLPFAPACARGADDFAIEDYKQAANFYRKSRWKLAAESFEAFLKRSPQHRKAETATFYLGLTYINLENHRQARETLRRFVSNFPKSEFRVQALYWLGQSSYILQDFPAAEQELVQFVAAAPVGEVLRERALPYLADAEQRQKKYQPALTHFLQSLKEFPHGVLAEDCRFGAATCYEKLGKFPEAVTFYKGLAANRNGAHAAESQSILGGRYFDEGNYSAAVQAYADLERNFPESSFLPTARLNRGFALYRMEQYAAAAEQFDRLLQHSQLASEATLWKGMSLKAQGKLPAAEMQLAAGYAKFKSAPGSEKLLYEWADTVNRQGKYDEARRLYLDGVSRNPQGPLAAESLASATLAALLAGDLPGTGQLLSRFDRDYPNSPLRSRQQVFKGRLLLAQGNPAEAWKQLQDVLQKEKQDTILQQARYYAAVATQKLGDHAQCLNVSQPLVVALSRDNSTQELVGILVVRGVSELELGKKTSPKTAARERLTRFQNAVQSAEKYLGLAPQGALREQAWGLIALGAAHGGQKAASQAALKQLQGGGGRAEYDRILLELAELALGNEDAAWASQLFGELATRPHDSPFRARGISGLAWAQFQAKKFDEAADSFGRLVDEHPQDSLAAQSAFMRGKSLQNAGKLPPALQAYQAAFQKYPTADSSLLAGLQVARVGTLLNQPEAADAAYTAVFEKFPNPAQGDRILNEWATMNYNAGRFDRSDEISRRLAREYPASPFADDAQLSLAESDLIGGRTAAARTAFSTLQANPKSDKDVQQRSLLQLMLIEQQAGHWTELRKHAQDSLTRFPAGTYRREAEFHAAEAEIQLQFYKESRDRLVRLTAAPLPEDLKHAAWFPRVWVLLAEAQYRLKDYPGVFKTAEDFRRADPKSPVLYQVEEVVGRVFKSQAKFPEAREAFLRVIRHPDGQATETAAKSQFQIAETYLLQKNFQQAALEYLRLDSDEYKGFPAWQAPALFQAGQCHEALSDWKEAAIDYDGLIARFPQSEFAAKAKDRLVVVRTKGAG